MARSKLREEQVKDTDFLSEEEHATVAHTFDELIDVPAFSGNEGKYLRVDSTASGIEYVTISGVSGTGGSVFVNRGDPTDYDWLVGDFTTDGTWRDLDCSSIAPSGASAIYFRMRVLDNAAGSYFYLRKNGNSNARNISGVQTQVSNEAIEGTMFVPCDSNRIVEYLAANTAFTEISVLILGWLVPGSACGDCLTEEEHANLTHYFTDLGDTPTLSGNGGKILRVKSDGTALEFDSWTEMYSQTYSPPSGTVDFSFSGGYSSPGSAEVDFIFAVVYNISNGDKIFLNSTDGAFEVVLPSSPSMGDFVSFIDGAGYCASNNVTISGSGQKIMGSYSNYVVDENYEAFDLVYYDLGNGWIKK